MVDKERRERFKFNRLGYYQAGRLLGFSGVGIHSHFIMLGYAVESHIKAGLAELEFQKIKFSSSEKKLIYGHEIKNLFHLGAKYGLFKNIKVTDDFLEVVQNFLHTRYPSQQLESQEKIKKDNPFGYALSVYNVFPYDDLICQLDAELAILADDKNQSIIYLAAKYMGTKESRVLFHCNAFAFNTLQPVWQDLLNDSSVYEHNLATLKLGKNILWNSGYGSIVPFEMESSIISEYNCNSFKLSNTVEVTNQGDSEAIIITSHGPISFGN